MNEDSLDGGRNFSTTEDNIEGTLEQVVGDTIENQASETIAWEGPSNSARVTFDEVRDSGPPTINIEFPQPNINRAMVDTITYYDRDSPDFFPKQPALFRVSNEGNRQMTNCAYALNPDNIKRRTQMGYIQCCLILEKHITDVGEIIFIPTNKYAAVKISSKQTIFKKWMNGDCRTENPWQEVSALQFIENYYHPNILGIIEALHDDDNLYTVMPFCPGGDLYDNIGPKGCPEQVARSYFQQILNGLDQLQNCGIFHRDLSLENILLIGERCVFIDFGMCLKIPMGENGIRRLMLPVGVGGKVNYMAPEIFCNRESNRYGIDGPSCDLWAAGVILFVLLTGKFPYLQPDTNDIAFGCTINNIAGLLETFDREISPSALDLLRKIFQLFPGKRYTLAQVMEHPWVTSG